MLFDLFESNAQKQILDTILKLKTTLPQDKSSIGDIVTRKLDLIYNYNIKNEDNFDIYKLFDSLKKTLKYFSIYAYQIGTIDNTDRSNINYLEDSIPDLGNKIIYASLYMENLDYKIAYPSLIQNSSELKIKQLISFYDSEFPDIKEKLSNLKEASTQVKKLTGYSFYDNPFLKDETVKTKLSKLVYKLNDITNFLQTSIERNKESFIKEITQESNFKKLNTKTYLWIGKESDLKKIFKNFKQYLHADTEFTHFKECFSGINVDEIQTPLRIIDTKFSASDLIYFTDLLIGKHSVSKESNRNWLRLKAVFKSHNGSEITTNFKVLKSNLETEYSSESMKKVESIFN